MGFFGSLVGKQRTATDAPTHERGPAAVTRPSMPVFALEPAGLPACWLVSAAITDVGLVRNNNEDNVRVLQDPDIGVSLALLADGMGGHASGEVASDMALEAVIEGFRQKNPHQTLSSVLVETFSQANSCVWQHAQTYPETAGMGTTLCALAFDRRFGVHLSWVGDSRIYLLHDGSLQQLTRDDTLVNHMLEQGLLTPEQAQNHPDAHVLSQALGTHDALRQVNSLKIEGPIEVGDVFLLTSDGVHDVLPPESMCRLLSGDDPYSSAQSLIDAAKAAGSTDNLSVVVVQVATPKNRHTLSPTTRS